MQRSLTDSAKVFAAIAVIGIHATSTAEYSFLRDHRYFSLDFLGVIVNQWARFSVPLFLYLSAYGLAKSEKSAGRGFLKDYGNFLLKRLPTILVPYLFFSAIALAMEFHSWQAGRGEAAAPADFLARVLQKLRTGGADYHLYFLVILAQCYVLFPVLMRTARSSTSLFRIFVWLSLLLVSLLLYKGSSEMILGKLGIAHPGWHASFAIYWLPYFMLGVLHAPRPPRRWNSIDSFLTLLVALAYVLLEYDYYSLQSTPVDYYNHFSRPSVMLYALTVIWLLHAMPENRLAERTERIAAWAGLTFSVYLIHPQILRLVNNYLPHLPAVFGWILVTVTTFSLVYALTTLTGKIQEKGPAVLAGPVRFLQRCLGLR